MFIYLLRHLSPVGFWKVRAGLNNLPKSCHRENVDLHSMVRWLIATSTGLIPSSQDHAPRQGCKAGERMNGRHQKKTRRLPSLTNNTQFRNFPGKSAP